MNSLGNHFKVTSFGESHGPAVGCILEGCPAGFAINIEKINAQLFRRKTNQSSFTSSRNEKDEVEFLSGVFNEITTGSPITLVIRNTDQRSQDYEMIKEQFRPGHADYTYHQKYNHRDYRGGGRSSIRITAPLVAAGEIARQLINHYEQVTTTAFVNRIGPVAIPELDVLDLETIENNSFRCPHAETANLMQALVDEVSKEGDTLGGEITCIVQNLPAGIGEPIFGKLQAQLGHAMLSINTVKAIEFGDGFKQAQYRGSYNNDTFISKDGNIKTSTNHDGGIQGGISNGMPIHFKIALKPISSISIPQATINQAGEPSIVSVSGRHDVCAVPRAVPIVEAYTNIVLADLFLLSRLNNLT